MTASFVKSVTRGLHRRTTRGLVAFSLVAGLLGCDGGASSASRDGTAATAPATRPAPLPNLTFPSELRASFPEVSAFLDEFLDTCMGGGEDDYARYRRLVSRAFTPESRDRFEAIFHATKSVTIESIEEVELALLPPPVYRVVTSVELHPERQVKLRDPHRKVAILVFKEVEDWRMAPAPAALQPQEEPPPATSSAPTTSGPTYPWDEEGDY